MSVVIETLMYALYIAKRVLNQMEIRMANCSAVGFVSTNATYF